MGMGELMAERSDELGHEEMCVLMAEAIDELMTEGVGVLMACGNGYING